MTQELLDLFIEYQIPSDLLSYDGPGESSTDEKLGRVKQYIAKMYEMIELSKQRELEQEREREAMRLAEQNRTYAPPPSPGPPPRPMMMPTSGPSGMVMGSPPPSFGPPPGMPAMSAPPMPAPAQIAVPQPAPVTATTTPPPKAASQPVKLAEAAATGDGEVGDYTRIPGELDKKFESLDVDGALRATIINPGDPWSRTSQKGLLGSTTTTTLGAGEQRTHKNRAFDLLDALSKSGALGIDDASLHVVLAATHCFDKTLVDTVIQDNVNPIEKVERSLMIVGTTIHGRSAAEMLAAEQRDRFFTTSPQLQLDDGSRD